MFQPPDAMKAEGWTESSYTAALLMSAANNDLSSHETLFQMKRPAVRIPLTGTDLATLDHQIRAAILAHYHLPGV